MDDRCAKTMDDRFAGTKGNSSAKMETASFFLSSLGLLAAPKLYAKAGRAFSVILSVAKNPGNQYV
jgi:hypothetical protein